MKANASSLAAICVFTLCLASCGSTTSLSPEPPAPVAPARTAVWTPSLTDTFQWQLSGKFDPSIAATVYDLDAFETTAATVDLLHKANRHVVCYVDAGAFEKSRSDAAAFPTSIVGAPYVGYPDEAWLDIRQLSLLAPIMDARLDLCKSKGFDAVEPDNIDGFQNETGFPLKAIDQLTYNRWFADHAHARGLAISLKNDGDQALDLLPVFDFVLSEDCWQQSACSAYTPFITMSKPVFTVEYTDVTKPSVFHETVCPKANVAKMRAILKNRILDAALEVCP